MQWFSFSGLIPGPLFFGQMRWATKEEDIIKLFSVLLSLTLKIILDSLIYQILLNFQDLFFVIIWFSMPLFFLMKELYSITLAGFIGQRETKSYCRERGWWWNWNHLPWFASSDHVGPITPFNMLFLFYCSMLLKGSTQAFILQWRNTYFCTTF